MRIVLATPVRPGATSGNDVTAARWARRLTELGHDMFTVPVTPGDPSPTASTQREMLERGDPADAFQPSAGELDDVDPADTVHPAEGELNDADLLVALHARRSAPVISWWQAKRAGQPIVVGLTGTDLYRDLPDDPDAQASLQAAARLVVLQPKGVDRLRTFAPDLVVRTAVVHQSVEPPLPTRQPGRERDRDGLGVVVLAHLRDVKDPLLAARAARLLPAGSRVRIDHAGEAHDDGWRQAAQRELDENPRYRWHGELARPEALALLAEADVLACTSLLEGGANVVSEAIALGVPVVGTLIDGNTGLLGDDYPGLVPVGDAEALAHLLARLEQDDEALADLQARVEVRRHLTDPAHERRAWADVLADLF